MSRLVKVGLVLLVVEIIGILTHSLGFAMLVFVIGLLIWALAAVQQAIGRAFHRRDDQ